jgi:hypothetical protein
MAKKVRDSGGKLYSSFQRPVYALSDVLVVIPEPSVIALVAIFGGGLWFIRRYFPSV